MEGNTLVHHAVTPQKTINVSSAPDRSVPTLKSPYSLGPNGIPKASSITRSPQAFFSEDGDFGVLDIFVDSMDFELHETVRSLRFTAASTNISNLFPSTPRSEITLPPSSLTKNKLLDDENHSQVGGTVDNHMLYNRVEESEEMTVGEGEEGQNTSKTGIVKPLSAEALVKARCEIDALEIEPVTPLRAEEEEAFEPESRTFSLSPRSRKILEKLSIRREKKGASKTAEKASPKAEDEKTAQPASQPLSKLASGLERLFSRISNTSKAQDQGDDEPRASQESFIIHASPQNKLKSKLAKWKGNIGKFFGHSS